MNARRVAIVWALLLWGARVPGARAQVGTTTDILTGIVTDETGVLLAGAVVEAQSLETEITRRVRTDGHGRYTILFPDGGGAYQMTARYLGMRPEQVTLQRFADEDRLEWNPRLSAAAIVMDTVTVRAPPRAVTVPDLPTPGSTERAFTEEMLSRLPLDQEDLNSLASLVPGVVAVEATDSTAAAYSVGGLRLDANAFTVDGLNFGGASLPQEGLRSTRVITGTYDVSRGQFSGGLVASTTRGGSNMIQGSSGYALRDQDLAFGGDARSAFTQGYTQNQLSGGLVTLTSRFGMHVINQAQAYLSRSVQNSTPHAAGGASTGTLRAARRIGRRERPRVRRQHGHALERPQHEPPGHRRDVLAARRGATSREARRVSPGAGVRQSQLGE